ncbi:p2xE, partial [Symbiodinium microadriaticum]
PAEYAAAHLFPATFAALRPLSPRAAWVSVDPNRVQPANFAEVVQSVSGWGCPYVLLKDFVKSAKAHGQRFMKVPVDGDLSELACDFVAARGSQFNEGVVFKEYVDLVRYPARGEPTTNEWRLWLRDPTMDSPRRNFVHGRASKFMQGLLVEASPNSFQGDAAVPPSEALLAEVAKMAKCIPNPYITIDVAEAETGWIVLEAGDGGVSGPAPGQDLRHHWQLLAAHFGKADGPSA